MPGATRLGDLVRGTDGHGCRRCMHTVTGGATTITLGSPNVFINGKPVARVGDMGRHSGCCGPNIFTHVIGSSTVFINGRQAVRLGDMVRHCGGVDSVIVSSTDVFIGG